MPDKNNNESPKKRRRKPRVTTMIKNGEHVSPNIVLCEDGKYRWTYDLSLFKNPTIFVLVWKVFFISLLVIFTFVFGVDSCSNGIRPNALIDDLKFFAYFLIGMTVLVALGYLLYAAVMGGKYCVLFEMDEKSINHKQRAEQAKKARKLGQLTSAAGAAAGNLTTVGVGMNATRTEMSTDFAGVRSVKAYRRRNLIKLNGLLSRNQVYAANEDFDFVLDYILSHVPETTKKKIK